MAKKSGRRPARGQNWLIGPAQVREWLRTAAGQLVARDYPAVVETCRRVLRVVPGRVAERGTALQYLGLAHQMLREFGRSYAELSQALDISPSDSHLWYNRSLAAQMVMRFGQSLRDAERAVELEGSGDMADRLAEQLAVSRKVVDDSLEIRGPEFTLDQLIEQEDLFQRGLASMTAGHWAEAEGVFRRVIAMADCLPQPWGNVAGSLLMQRRFDEAEAAYRRALEIDPNYELAKTNLAGIPKIRRSGILPRFAHSSPWDHCELRQDIDFVAERP